MNKQKNKNPNKILSYCKIFCIIVIVFSVNKLKAQLITEDLEFYINAMSLDSYSGSESSWNDLSGNNYDVELFDTEYKNNESDTFSKYFKFNNASSYGAIKDLNYNNTDPDYNNIEELIVIAGVSAYFWNGDTSSCETKTLGIHPDYEIALGQGFFVEAAANNANLTFDVNDVSHQSNATFQRTTSARPEITLNLSDGVNNTYTKVYYIEGTTVGYDLGYDGRLFGGVSHTFTIFSDLVESDGNKYQYQSLPNQEHETMVIPIGVIADAGKEITFTAEALNLPNDLKVYLEDVENNILTRLDEANTNYTVILNDASSDIGRFYLHTKSSDSDNTDDLPLIVISEICYNSNENNGNNDEWIEIFNASGSNVNISSWSIENTSSSFNGTFTFPSNSIIDNGAYITIAFGSNGDGTYNNDKEFEPDYTNLGVEVNDVANTNDTGHISNTSSTFTLKKSDGEIVDQVIYSDTDFDATSGISHDGGGLTLELIDPLVDNSSTNSNWQTSGINGGTPGAVNASYWTGAENSSEWSNSSNWTAIGVPSSSANIMIPAGLDTYPTILEDINVGHISIESGATLISKFLIDGIVTYQRNLENGAQWYLMASPVVNETYNDDWVSANEIASGQGDNRAVSIYDNSSLDNDTGHWQYYQAGGSETTFNSAQGYGILKSTAGTVSFTGAGIYSETQTFNLIQSDSDNTSSSTSNNYNLVGNPFTAYLNLGDFFLVNKDSVIVGASAYFWNGDTSSYDTRTSGIDSEYEIAPGQGFFVQAAANNANLTFDINDISHLAETSESSDTFQRTTNTRPEITLNLSDGNNNRYVKVFYIDGTTQGYDLGFDGRSFGGVSNTFTIFLNLVESDGNKYQIQSLPNQEHETMVIPIGVIADAGKEITFTAEALNLPNDLKVYVEDRENNTLTRLDEANTNYTITLDSSSNGIGRFYLHTTGAVLNTDNIELQGISIYTKDKNTLCIYGIHNSQATISIYSILGKNVVNKSFNSKGVTDIKLPNLKRGIYIIHIATEKGKITKKILL